MSGIVRFIVRFVTSTLPSLAGYASSTPSLSSSRYSPRSRPPIASTVPGDLNLTPIQATALVDALAIARTPSQSAALAAAIEISRTVLGVPAEPDTWPPGLVMPTPIYPSETPVDMPASRAAGKFWLVIVGYRVGVFDNMDDALRVVTHLNGYQLVNGTYQWCVGEFHRVYHSQVKVIPWPSWLPDVI